MQNKGPFDSKAIIAVLIVGVFYLGWQNYLSKKYHTDVPAAATTTAPTATSATPPAENAASVKSANPEVKAVEKKEENISFENEKISAQISNKGMGFHEVSLKKFMDKEDKEVKVSSGDLSGLYELRIDKNPIFFDVKKVSDKEFSGTFEDSDWKIQRSLLFSDGYSVKSTVSVTPKTGKIPKLSILMSEKIQQAKSSSWLFPSYDHQDFNIVDNNKSQVINFSKSKENVQKEFSPVIVAGISSQYFTTSFLDASSLLPNAKLSSELNTSNALVELSYEPSQQEKDFTFVQTLYMGPKLLNELTNVDPQLSQIVDFGMLGWLARPMLSVMKVFYTWTMNWGFAIIFLTLLVRLVVLPFNVVSYRSMKAMQKIQPLIAELRERYKDDPMTLNKQMMALMKDHKANPLSGCLPMVFQIPVFFALFRVIGSSVELYRSPFIFWIHDLSSRDPYFVLPVIMGITMFLQQKLTPTTMDPVQARILSFLPIVFAVFMLNLPSGLTLYMCVSAIFGIVQQWSMLKNSQKAGGKA